MNSESNYCESYNSLNNINTFTSTCGEDESNSNEYIITFCNKFQNFDNIFKLSKKEIKDYLPKYSYLIFQSDLNSNFNANTNSNSNSKKNENKMSNKEKIFNGVKNFYSDEEYMKMKGFYSYCYDKFEFKKYIEQILSKNVKIPTWSSKLNIREKVFLIIKSLIFNNMPGFLLRMLIENEYEYENTLKMILNHFEFTKKYLIKKSDDVKKLFQSKSLYIFGRDFEYSPNLIINLEKLLICFKGSSRKSMISFGIFILNYIESYIIIPGQIERINILLDCNNVNDIPDSFLEILYKFSAFKSIKISKIFVLNNRLEYIKDILKKFSKNLNSTYFINDFSMMKIFYNSSQLEMKYGGTFENLEDSKNFNFLKITDDRFETSETSNSNLIILSKEEYYNKYHDNDLFYKVESLLNDIMSMKSYLCLKKTDSNNLKISNESKIIKKKDSIDNSLIISNALSNISNDRCLSCKIELINLYDKYCSNSIKKSNSNASKDFEKKLVESLKSDKNENSCASCVKNMKNSISKNTASHYCTSKGLLKSKLLSSKLSNERLKVIPEFPIGKNIKKKINIFTSKIPENDKKMFNENRINNYKDISDSKKDFITDIFKTNLSKNDKNGLSLSPIKSYLFEDYEKFNYLNKKDISSDSSINSINSLDSINYKDSPLNFTFSNLSTKNKNTSGKENIKKI